MSQIYVRVAVSGFLLLSSVATCALPGNAAALENQKSRIERLENAVLAPCCYTEPVSRHQSEIALKMRIEIARWVTDGRTDQQILGTYVQLYGSKVLVDPRTAPAWWTPWIPWLTVISATSFGFWLLRRWRPKPLIQPADHAYAALPDFDEDE
jgi:cytochrome c-type biogenesis protein CcmH/NrfF